MNLYFSQYFADCLLTSVCCFIIVTSAVVSKSKTGSKIKLVVSLISEMVDC